MKWLCDKCGTGNPDFLQRCLHCFQARSAAAKVIPVDGSDDSGQEKTWPCVPSDQFGFRRLTAYFAWSAKLAQLPYFLWMFVQLSVVLALAIGLVSSAHLPPRTTLNRMSDLELILGGVVLAPLLETLLFQALFCAIGRSLKLGFWRQVILVWVPFFLIHFGEGVGTALCVGLVGGFFFSLTYVTKRSESFLRAYWTTVALHAANNGIALIALIAARHPPS